LKRQADTPFLGGPIKFGRPKHHRIETAERGATEFML